MTFFWLIMLIILLAVEALTMGLTSIWFAAGALASCISAAVDAPLWLQILWFILVSAVLLCFTRPFAQKYLKPARRHTNADMVLDTTGIVEEEINNFSGTGKVRASGKLWTARAKNDEIIPVGVQVSPLEIQGVKLIVTPTKVSAENML